MAKLMLPKLEKRYKDVLSAGEVERLLAELNTKTFRGARMGAIVALLYDSGLRAGEMVGLDVHDIDWGCIRSGCWAKARKSGWCPLGRSRSASYGATSPCATPWSGIVTPSS